ncbi:MAG: glycosyltransferase [Acidobacteria bacterium]|nr:glycosyltransferase [Acidobacteriota bacterium]
MVKRIAKLIFLCVAPVLLGLLAVVFFLEDLWTRLMKSGRRNAPPAVDGDAPHFPPRNASIVIPNWNGKDLLEKFLPSVVEACGPADEIIVVDNASTDGSADYVSQRFPQVRLLQMDRNLGFGGGSNAGVRAARHAVVVLLNNDMRVTPDFLPALLGGFTDPNVFAVSAQIFFSDPSRRREETGLTSGRFGKGFFRVRHDLEDRIQKTYPTFYAGGGSTAYDREKFLELGGFDPLFEPFYLEDTDLSYNAWRRGWKVLYQPQAHVYHEHRATIARHFTPEAIQSYLQKNYVLMVWKNLHQTRWLWSHWFFLYGHMLLICLGWETETRTTMGAFIHALKRLPQALRSRRAALLRAAISDPEVFERLRPSVFRESFLPAPAPLREMRSSPKETLSSTLHSAPPAQQEPPLNILFVSPYSIYPPLHGGAVFMLQAIQELAKHHNLFVLTFVDSSEEVEPNRALEQWARTVEILVRKHRPSQPFQLSSHAEQTFYDPEFASLIDKMVYLHDIDLIQFEYTQLAQYRLPLRTVPQCLFEHDIYFRSVARQLLAGRGGWIEKSQELLEWLRGLRYEVAAAEKFDVIFTCHEQEQRVLKSFLGNGRPWILPGMRTAVDAAGYRFPGGPRQADSLLFVGNFQHRPNAEGLTYFCDEVLPLIREERPGVTLNIVGAGASEDWEQRFSGEGIRLLGQVPDIRDPLGSYSVFVCPIRTGAGVRVKILEAFASGIPVVSTSLGAEGIAARSGHDILLADTPAEFARECLKLLEQPQLAETIAASARRLVETRYNWPVAVAELDRAYREIVRRKRGALSRRLALPAIRSLSRPIAR